MNHSDRLKRIACEPCGWHRVYGPEEMVQRLRDIGKFRREAKPDSEIVIELFSTQLNTMKCEMCRSTGLVIKDFVVDDLDDELSGGWQEARSCEVCKKTIPAERLEIFPHEKRCAACKDKPLDDEVEYCDRCGGILRMQGTGGSGVSRYVMVCSDCGRK